MTLEEKRAALTERKARGYPWHEPPHFHEGARLYLLTAACFEHRKILNTAVRLSEFVQDLVGTFEQEINGRLHAWVVLPNHYHLLADVDLAVFRKWVGHLHNGKSTQWNREDRTPARRVWYRFSDRMIRNERHCYASINYIHFNPVKHDYVESAREWPWCSVHEYLENIGRERLAVWWRRYPIRGYGKGWDEY